MEIGVSLTPNRDEKSDIVIFLPGWFLQWSSLIFTMISWQTLLKHIGYRGACKNILKGMYGDGILKKELPLWPI